jgi:hypothetical protein
MKSFDLYWSPSGLTTGLRQIRMETCRELSPILETHDKTKFQRLVTGTRVSSLWNFIMLQNKAYREMISLKR